MKFSFILLLLRAKIVTRYLFFSPTFAFSQCHNRTDRIQTRSTWYNNSNEYGEILETQQIWTSLKRVGQKCDVFWLSQYYSNGKVLKGFSSRDISSGSTFFFSLAFYIDRRLNNSQQKVFNLSGFCISKSTELFMKFIWERVFSRPIQIWKYPFQNHIETVY